MYRILSPTAILGYGFPEESFHRAMKLKLDLIAVDAGSMDAGPYYLGSGAHYCAETALIRDLELIISGALQQDCPLVIGSAGFAGSSPQIEDIVNITRQILERVQASVRVAVISSDIPVSMLESRLETLKPLGSMPDLDKKLPDQSVAVAQMGSEPIIAALDAGAKIIICGRCYDPSVFAADAIRKGYPRGLAYHAAKILECGAIACEPGSGSDCLVAELTEEQAVFYPTNPQRVATARSIAAHTLYEKSMPDVFHLPGGTLNIKNTRFYQVDRQKAGFSGSEFTPERYSVKIEASAPVGERVISLVPLKQGFKVSDDIRVYGHDAVEIFDNGSQVPEMGIITMVRGENREKTRDALAFIRSTLLHYGYHGRLSTAGNLAFPFSPSDILLDQHNGVYRYCFIAGTRDPVFRSKWPDIQNEVLTILAQEHPELSNSCEIEFIEADSENPLALLETVAPALDSALKQDKIKRQSITAFQDPDRQAFSGISTGKVYQWCLHHLTYEQQLIEQLFEVKLMDLNGETWKPLPGIRPRYQFQGSASEHEMAPALSEAISIDPVTSSETPETPLKQVAKVIRSKNSGINLITFDVIFESPSWYQRAILSGKFDSSQLAKMFRVDQSTVESHTFDPVNAIKFTIQRPQLSGGPGDKDVFGAQQHTRLLNILL